MEILEEKNGFLFLSKNRAALDWRHVLGKFCHDFSWGQRTTRKEVVICSKGGAKVREAWGWEKYIKMSHGGVMLLWCQTKDGAEDKHTSVTRWCGMICKRCEICFDFDLSYSYISMACVWLGPLLLLVITPRSGISINTRVEYSITMTQITVVNECIWQLGYVCVCAVAKLVIVASCSRKTSNS